MSKRVVVAAGLAVLAVLALMIWAITPRDQQAAADPVSIGGPFALTDQTGRQVRAEDFDGRFMLVYFGYTYCPDICPLGLQTITQALEQMPPAAADRVTPIFITVDPARDTVPVMRDYVSSFHPRLVGLTGSEAEVAAVTKGYRVYARKADPAATEGYLVDHSTFTYVMGPDGEYLAHFGHDATPESMAKRLGELVAAG